MPCIDIAESAVLWCQHIAMKRSSKHSARNGMLPLMLVACCSAQGARRRVSQQVARYQECPKGVIAPYQVTLRIPLPRQPSHWHIVWQVLLSPHARVSHRNRKARCQTQHSSNNSSDRGKSFYRIEKMFRRMSACFLFSFTRPDIGNPGCLLEAGNVLEDVLG